MVEQNGNVMAFMDVLTHFGILRRRAAGNLPAGIEEAIAKVKTQHSQETGKLEVITVGGILAPDQVISLDTNLL